MAREEAEIKELSKKLAQNPDSMVFVQLADVLRRAGDLEQSVQVCQVGLERHPTYTTARAILGRNYLDLGKLDEAESEFRKIEVSDPENIMAHRMLGQIFMQKGQFAEAINRQQRVLSLDPEDSTAQELLQEALAKSKEAPSPASSAPKAEAAPVPPPKPAAASDQSGTIKVAEIYIKKRAYDEAAEVLQEVLSADPDNSVARQKLQEVNELRKKADPIGSQAAEAAEAQARKKAEDEARAKAEAEAKAKAEQEARAKAAAEAEAKKKAEDEARAKAEAEAKAKAEQEARAKAAAEAEAKKKAEDEARAKAEAEAKAKAEEEARAKAAEAEAKKKAEDEARAKAEAEAKKKAEEAERAKAEAEAKKLADEEAADARRRADEAAKREQEEKDRKASKLSNDDILSVIASSAEDLIGEEPAAPSRPSGAPAGTAKVAAGASGQAQAAPQGVSPEAKTAIDEFIRAQAMEASLLLDLKGKVLEAKVSGDAGALGTTAAAIFSNTEKAAQRMAFGNLRQIMIVGEDGRQILFVALKAGVLVALTGKNTNLGLLRVAVNDLVKKA